MTVFSFNGTAVTAGAPIYNLAANDALYLLENGVLIGDGDASPVVLNNNNFVRVDGAVLSTGHSAIRAAAGSNHDVVVGREGVVDFHVSGGPGSAIILIGSGGQVSNGGEIRSDSIGVSTGGSASIVANQGSIVALNGVVCDGADSRLINGGAIECTNIGVDFNGSNATLRNSGLIHGLDRGVGGADGFMAANSGTIYGAFGIIGAGASCTVRNTGEISGDTRGIRVNGVGVIVNAGTISSAEQAIAGLTAASSLSIRNSGEIIAAEEAIDALASTGADVVRNTGLIVGDVLLGGGDDLLDTAKGALAGLIDLGDGADQLIGSAGDDSALGGSGNDNLNGKAGDDALNGGVNSDILAGGAGDDLLTGGFGADRFAFRAGFGHDEVTDLNSADKIHFSRDAFQNFADVQASMVQVGADVLITADDGSTLLLRGTALASLDASDFLFG